MRGFRGLCMLIACYFSSALLAPPIATAKYDHRWPRLFVDKPLAAVAALPLDDAQLRYLSTVLRLKNGAAVRIFDGQSGEYKAILSGLPERKSKRTTAAVLQIGDAIRAQSEDDSNMNVWLLCASIRKQRMKLLIEKATELGAARIVPVVTAFTQESLDAEGVNRLTDVAVEAAEQSERLTLPSIAPATPLSTLLQDWRSAAGCAHRQLFVCQERSLTATPLLTALQRSVNNAENSAVEWAVLIGPEGGFSPDEKQLLLQYCTDTDWCVPVSLGSTVLRSETAAMYALSCCSAVADAQRAVEPAAAAAA